MKSWHHRLALGGTEVVKYFTHVFLLLNVRRLIKYLHVCLSDLLFLKLFCSGSLIGLCHFLVEFLSRLLGIEWVTRLIQVVNTLVIFKILWLFISDRGYVSYVILNLLTSLWNVRCGFLRLWWVERLRSHGFTVHFLGLLFRQFTIVFSDYTEQVTPVLSSTLITYFWRFTLHKLFLPILVVVRFPVRLLVYSIFDELANSFLGSLLAFLLCWQVFDSLETHPLATASFE